MRDKEREREGEKEKERGEKRRRERGEKEKERASGVNDIKRSLVVYLYAYSLVFVKTMDRSIKNYHSSRATKVLFPVQTSPEYCEVPYLCNRWRCHFCYQH